MVRLQASGATLACVPRNKHFPQMKTNDRGSLQ
jgi:hypothetical protein